MTDERLCYLERDLYVDDVTSGQPLVRLHMREGEPIEFRISLRAAAALSVALDGAVRASLEAGERGPELPMGARWDRDPYLGEQ